MTKTIIMVQSRICLFTMLLLIAGIVNGQQEQMTLGYVKMSLLHSSVLKNYTNVFQPKNIVIASASDSSAIKFAPSTIAPTYYTEHLGMMCKEELKLEKAIKIPLRIRLGSKDQVDYLEGKNYNH